MGYFGKRSVRRRRDGSYDLDLDEQECAVLTRYLEQLRDLLMGDDPALRRLFPPAYPDDPARDKEYQQLMRGELLESRFASIETMEATLGQKTVDEATLTSWMQSINALRLVLGTLLDLGEEPVEVDPEDPQYALHGLYEYLGSLLYEIVKALTEGLPPPSADNPPPGGP